MPSSILDFFNVVGFGACNIVQSLPAAPPSYLQSGLMPTELNGLWVIDSVGINTKWTRNFKDMYFTMRKVYPHEYFLFKVL